MVDNSRTILILNIKIDGTRNEDLVVKENDEPEEIALEFCNKHNLPIYLKDVLIKNIEENLDVFIEEEVGENTKFLSSTNSKIANAESEHRRTGSAKNYGEVLYDKGIMLKQKVEYMVQVQKQSLLEKEMRNMTFKPKINPYMLKPRGISEGCARKLSQKRIEEQTICTFKPTINKYRGKSKENTKKTDKCVELYQSAARIKQKREEKGRKM